jgi:hypothetical protein
LRRTSRLAIAVVGVVAPLGCVWRLDGEFLPDGGTYEPDAGVDAATQPDAGSVAVAAGCTLFTGLPGVTSLAGDAHSLSSAVPSADGGTGALWVVDQAVTTDGGTESPAAIAVGASASGGCAGWSSTFEGAGTTESPLEDGGAIVPLDLVATSSGPALYYQVAAPDPTAPLGLRALGFGVAAMGASGKFAMTADLLWTPDRPAYGSSALRIGDVVFTWGCKSTDAFDADCFVAQVPAAHVEDASAYTYWAGHAWSSEVDDATAVVSAGGAVSVRPDPRGAGRLLMTYVPPLGSTILVRSAIAPQGPWSTPVRLGACDLSGAGPGSFCSGGEQHPELVAGQDAIALTYDARSFTPDAGTPAAFEPRLATFAVPSELP